MKKTLSIALVSILMFALSACGSQPVAPTVEPTPPVPEQSVAPAPELPQPAPNDDRGIAGMNASELYEIYDDSFSVPVGKLKPTTAEAADYCATTCVSHAENSTTHYTYDYSLSIDEEGEIVGASVGIECGLEGSNESFLDAAKLYLQVVGKMSYDTCEQENTAAWIDKSIPAAAETDGGISTTVGDAKFELYGTKFGDEYASFWIDVSKSK